MSSDPNRDLLPVKEDSKSGKGFSDKFDHLILGKLSRCELEDRFLRLLDEQTHIKKLANSQEEKIKRLGTKLLRLINEKKSGKKFSEPTKEAEELQLRIIELEHENYSLKDKNTVLKQQLSSHSRHLSTHRSPVLSNHTSPLMTVRQSAPTFQVPSEGAFDPINKNIAAEMQLQEAEAHIRGLNDEIKSLHSKIDYLQQNLEKNNLDIRKTKVVENIELIRLQRSLKQQAIQIAALQAQVKNSEKTQKILKEELVKAHKENDEALHLISVKQNEILNLCSKLEEKNLNRLEEDELKERINDLMMERDNLKERSEFLMKSISAKDEESEKINELQRLLAEEKSKKEKLEEDLLQLKNNNFLISPSKEGSEVTHIDKIKITYNPQPVMPSEKKETVNCATKADLDSQSSRSSECSLNREIESDTDREQPEIRGGKVEVVKKITASEGKCAVEKMKLELELQYLKEMLRSQTLRCETQQAEISRLMFELKLNEEKCSETLQRLDWHLKIFESLELRAYHNQLFPNSERIEKKLENDSESINCKESLKSSESSKPRVNHQSSTILQKEITPLPSREIPKSNNDNTKRMDSSSEDKFPSKLVSSEKRHSLISNNETTLKRQNTPEQKKRFVDQTFLESSDEYDAAGSSVRENVVKKSEKRGGDYGLWQTRGRDSEGRDKRASTFTRKTPIAKKKSFSSALSDSNSEINLPSKPSESDNKKGRVAIAQNDFMRRFTSAEDANTVTIRILWFKIRSDSSFWKNDNIEMMFIDFLFLDINGVETETPQSVDIPKSSDKKCEFYFARTINISGDNMRALKSILKNQEAALFVFKLVSDSKRFDETNEECVDFGIAVLTSKEFLNFSGKGPLEIQVKSIENSKEVIGTLAVEVEATDNILSLANR